MWEYKQNYTAVVFGTEETNTMKEKKSKKPEKKLKLNKSEKKVKEKKGEKTKSKPVKSRKYKTSMEVNPPRNCLPI